MSTKRIKIYFAATLLFFAGNSSLHSQDLENILNDEVGATTDYTSATFKSTRVVNGQSIERMPQGQLDFRIHHRFGAVNGNLYQFYGLDQAITHLSLEYGITDWVMVGLGRGSFEKTYNGLVKFSLLRQSSGARNMPVSVSYFAASDFRSADFTNVDSVMKNSNYPSSARFSYVNQILIARKFNSTFSAQLSPTWIHYNLTKLETEPHDVFAMGISGRVKLSTRVAFNAEYFYTLRPAQAYLSAQYYNSLSMGIDIETGGHVFQIILSNSQGMTDPVFIGRTPDKWNKGGIHLGFNISRVFDVNHKP